MAGYLTVYSATAILNGTAMPTTFWLKGHLDDPGPSALLHPALETRRLSFPLGTAVAGQVANSTRRVLGGGAAATEDWTYLSLWDAETSGNPWWIVPLATPLPVILGDAISLDIGALTLELERWS